MHVSVFDIEIDTNLFVTQIPTNKLEKARDATGEALSKQALTLHKAQSLIGFLSFCTQVLQLGWVFMRKLWDFVASYPMSSSRFAKHRILLKIRLDLEWWNQLLSVHNGPQFFDIQNGKTIQPYTDLSFLGLGGFFYKNNANFWSDCTSSIPQSQVFTVPILD